MTLPRGLSSDVQSQGVGRCAIKQGLRRFLLYHLIPARSALEVLEYAQTRVHGEASSGSFVAVGRGVQYRTSTMHNGE
jgi:hypothetical protein